MSLANLAFSDPTDDDESNLHGSTLDIVLFFLILALTWIVGTVHGCLSKATKGHGPTSNGLHGVELNGMHGRSKGSALQITRSNGLTDVAFVFTVMAAFAFISGLPSQIYFRGAFGVVLGGLPAVSVALCVVVLIYLPVFSAQEAPFADWKDYLRLRFESRSVLFLTMTLLAILWVIFAACAIYSLSLIFVQLIGLKHSMSLMLVVLICTVFVVIEGKSHVLLTDFILATLIFLSFTVVLVFGLVEHKGISTVIGVAQEFDINPESIDTIQSVFSSQLVVWLLLFGIFYSSDDRYAKMHSSRGALPLVLLNLPVAILILVICVMLGLISLSYFPPKCSPNEQSFQWPDQIFTRMITQWISPNIPGFSGLFFAALFALVLSLISTGFNFITGTFWSSLTKTSACLASEATNEHITSTSTPTAEAQRQVSTRTLSAFGCILSGILAVALQGKMAFGIGIAASTVVIGVVLGIFFCGLFVPYVSARGAVVGSLLTLLLGHWLSVGGIVRQGSHNGMLSPMENEMGCFGNLTLQPDLNGYDERFDSPHTPIQGAGKIVEKSAPSFLIPQRPKDSSSIGTGLGGFTSTIGGPNGPNGEGPRTIVPAVDHSLPRSPISNGGPVLASYVPAPPLARPLALASTGSAPNSPHQPSSSYGTGTNVGTGIGTGTGRIMPPNVATNSGGSGAVGNKPPLVLAKPELDGNNGYRFKGHGRQRASFHGLFQISYHYYGIISFASMVVLSVIFSIRLCPQSRCQGWEEGSHAPFGPTWITMDPRLIHPIARMLCCKCCRQRVAKPEPTSLQFNMEKRRSQMLAAGGLEEFNGHHLRHGSQQSQHRRISNETGCSQNSNNHERNDLSRRCSRHSHMSKRSSLASHGPTTTTTQADVLVTVNPSQSPIAMHSDIERRLSQLSDTEVAGVVAVAMDEVSRRNSNSSSYHRRLSPQVSLNVVPPSAGHSPIANLPSGGGSLLVPPTAEMLAQRRFSEVSAAIERHNSRRQAKRSQSVMYRQKRRASRRDSDIHRSVSPPDFSDYRRKHLQGVHSTPVVGSGSFPIPTISTSDQV